MKEETLKDWIKEWSFEQIIGNVVSEGMCFMANRSSEKHLKEYQEIIVNELKRRFVK